MRWLRRRGKYLKENPRNSVAYLAALAFAILAFISLPLAPTIPYPYSDHFVQSVSSTFPFGVNVTTTTPGYVTLQNGTKVNATLESSGIIMDGDATLSGVGGLSVDNPLKLKILLVPLPNMTKFIDPVNISVHPQFGLLSPITKDSMGIPEFSNITLTPHGNNWTGSGNVRYSESGDWSLALSVVNESGKTISIISAPVLEISSEEVTVSATNDAYTASLTFIIASLAVVALRKEK